MKPSLFDDLTSIPAIALDPRFAGLVRLAALGYPGKRLETRGCSTTYRGSVVIVATSGDGTKDNDRFAGNFLGARISLVGSGLVPADVFDEATSIRGAAVALATITGTRPLLPQDWPEAFFLPEPGERRFAWPLTNLWPLEPFPVRAQQSLFFRVPVREVARGAAEWLAHELHPWDPIARGMCERCLDGSDGDELARSPSGARLVCRRCFEEMALPPSEVDRAERSLRAGDLPGLGQRWAPL